jgi:CRISPR/Cas system-associated exonuclease Cas4 (RecB family)
MGTAIHAHSEGTDELVDSELPLHWDGLVGTADIVYKDGTVVDLKTSRWIFVEKLPYGSHSLQVNVYAHMLRKMGRDPKRLFIQYIDASGPTKCRKCRMPVRAFPTENGHELKCPSCFQFVKGAHLGAVMVEVALMQPDEIEAWITQRKEALDAALMMGLPPDREVGYLCSYCSNRPICAPEITDNP